MSLSLSVSAEFWGSRSLSDGGGSRPVETRSIFLGESQSTPGFASLREPTPTQRRQTQHPAIPHAVNAGVRPPTPAVTTLSSSHGFAPYFSNLAEIHESFADSKQALRTQSLFEFFFEAEVVKAKVTKRLLLVCLVLVVAAVVVFGRRSLKPSVASGGPPESLLLRAGNPQADGSESVGEQNGSNPAAESNGDTGLPALPDFQPTPPIAGALDSPSEAEQETGLAALPSLSDLPSLSSEPPSTNAPTASTTPSPNSDKPSSPFGLPDFGPAPSGQTNTDTKTESAPLPALSPLPTLDTSLPRKTKQQANDLLKQITATPTKSATPEPSTTAPTAPLGLPALPPAFSASSLTSPPEPVTKSTATPPLNRLPEIGSSPTFTNQPAARVARQSQPSATPPKSELQPLNQQPLNTAAASSMPSLPTFQSTPPVPPASTAPVRSAAPFAANPYMTRTAQAPRQQPSTTASRQPNTRQQHSIIDGDTLESISQHYYGSPNRAREIFEANRNVLPNPNLLPLRTRLSIPPAPTNRTGTPRPPSPGNNAAAMRSSLPAADPFISHNAPGTRESNQLPVIPETNRVPVKPLPARIENGMQQDLTPSTRLMAIPPA